MRVTDGCVRGGMGSCSATVRFRVYPGKVSHLSAGILRVPHRDSCIFHWEYPLVHFYFFFRGFFFSSFLGASHGTRTAPCSFGKCVRQCVGMHASPTPHTRDEEGEDARWRRRVRWLAIQLPQQQDSDHSSRASDVICLLFNTHAHYDKSGRQKAEKRSVALPITMNNDNEGPVEDLREARRMDVLRAAVTHRRGLAVVAPDGGGGRTYTRGDLLLIASRMRAEGSVLVVRFSSSLPSPVVLPLGFIYKRRDRSVFSFFGRIFFWTSF